MNLLQSIWVRMRNPLFIASVSLAILGVIVFVWLAATDNSSDGSGKFVVIPVLVACLLFTSGLIWFRSDHTKVGSRQCKVCGYDLRGHRMDATTCPECGKNPQTSDPRSELRTFVINLPGIILILLGLLFFGVAMFYWSFWKAGALGAV